MNTLKYLLFDFLLHASLTNPISDNFFQYSYLNHSTDIGNICTRRTATNNFLNFFIFYLATIIPILNHWQKIKLIQLLLIQKESVIAIIKNWMYKLPHEFPHNWGLRKLNNQELLRKPLECSVLKVSLQLASHNKKFSIESPILLDFVNLSQNFVKDSL